MAVSGIIYGQTTTNKILEVMLRDSSTGQGKTGVSYGSVVAYYAREGASSATQISVISGAAGAAYSSGKWAELDATNMPGVYQIHLPNAMFATGVASVTLAIQVSGAINVSLRFLIDAAVDAKRLAGTAQTAGVDIGTSLPTAGKNTVGGLPVLQSSGVGQHLSVPIATDLAMGYTTWESLAVGFVSAGASTLVLSYSANYPTVGATIIVRDASGAVCHRTITDVASDANITITVDSPWIATSGNDDFGFTPSATSSVIFVSAPGTAILSRPTAAANAAAVLDVAASSHNTAGTIGEKINSAGAAADPLLNAVPGAYAAGTAGYALGNSLYSQADRDAATAGPKQ